MELNNNQILLLAVAAVALYFFMKYRQCSKQENFGQLNSKDHKKWLDAWKNKMISCGVYLGKKNCKKTKKGFDSDWNFCKSKQTNKCLQHSDKHCDIFSSEYKKKQSR